MHTTECGETTFVHNSDLSGNVRIVAPVNSDYGVPDSTDLRPYIEIPGDALLEFIGFKLVDAIIARFEDMEPTEVLKLYVKGELRSILRRG